MAGLADNLARVRDRLARAAERSGRDAAAVTLVAVTKGHPAATVRALHALGQRDFGENRVQELLPKLDLQLPGARWHLIGHLQENKINKVLGRVHLIQSLDSTALMQAIDVRAGRAGSRARALLEVKTSPEPTKHGFALAAAEDAYRSAAEWPGLELCGLMTMAPYEAAERDLRVCFGSLRALRDHLRDCASPPAILSMGMSDDFEVAIEEGATLVRIGRAIVAG
jgi:pyridoxal phosphate enzyme (YggS family)